MKSIIFPACAGVIVVASLTTPSRGGGFGSAQFGGTHGNAASDSLTSIFYNPAGLALDDGTRAYAEAFIAYRTADYSRSTSAIDDQSGSPDAIAANSGAGTLSNTLASPFAAIATDLGHRGLALAVGISVPFGGQAEWGQIDKWKGNQMFPGAVDGAQRWSVTSGKQTSVFYTAAAAYRTRDNRLSFGVGLNIIQSQIQLTRARNIDGTDTLTNSDGSIAEGRSLLDVSEIGASLGLGIVFQVDGHTRIGVSYQSQPLTGEQKLDGTLTNKFGDAGLTTEQVEMRQRLPDSARLAVDWQGNTHALRAGVDWTHWSVYQDQCLVDATVKSSCQFLPNGGFDPTAEGSGPLLDIRRNWTDSWGLQGGGSWWPKTALELSASLRLDTNSIPSSTLEPAIMDANKLIGMVGARWTHGKLGIEVTLAHVSFANRETEPRSSVLVAPSRNPDMAGTYEQGVTFALVGVGVHL